MFLPVFLVFTLIFTLFENIVIAGISLLLVCLIFILYHVISKKEIFTKKTMSIILLTFLLAMMAFGVKEGMYYSDKSSFKSSTTSWFPSFQIKEEKSESIIGTGIVSDVSSQGKYVFSYQNKEYLLYSKKEYNIGDQLRIVGRIQNNNRNDGFSYRKISSGWFTVPLFTGSFDFPKWMKMKGRRGSIYEDNSLLLEVIPALSVGAGIYTRAIPAFAGMTPDQVGNDPRTSRGQAVLTGMTGDSEEEGRGNESGTMSPSMVRIKQLKRSIQEKVVEVYGKNRLSGLILGMLIGDKSLIPESEYQSFINSGLVHLVAVSGGNILMIVVFMHFILFFLPFYIRIGVILLTIVGYGFICGLDSSVFRAVLMGGMNMIAIFRGREINIWRLLSISCVFMLLINPYFLVYDTGFLLSYSALMGIIWFDSRVRENDGIEGKEKLEGIDGFPIKSGMTERGNEGIGTSTNHQVPRSNVCVQKGLKYVYKSYIAPSIGASIGIFPVIIFFMGKINILGILGNLFVLPIVPFVMIYGFVSVWIYSFLGWHRILWIEKVCVQYIYKISDLLAQYGLYFMVSGLRFKYVVLLVFVVGFVLWRFKKGGDIESGEVESGKLRSGEVR